MKRILLSMIALTVLGVSSSAQPGPACVLDYNPFEIKELGFMYPFKGSEPSNSSVAFNSRINSEHIFIGRIVDMEVNPKPNTIEGYRETYFESVKVRVIREVEGKLRIESLTLHVPSYCGATSGKVEVGKKYIFFANRISRGSFSGLVSTKWSAPVNDIPESELRLITKKISDVRKGVKQPSAEGYVIRHRANPYGDYVNSKMGSGGMWRDPKFTGDWRIMKFLYDPEYAEPLGGITVFAETEEQEIFKAKTDRQGRFEFKELPNGIYRIYPDVPDSYLVVGKCFLNDAHKGGVGVRFRENGAACDRAIRLDVQPAGSVGADIRLEKSAWEEATFLDIRFIGANSKTKEIYQNYTLFVPKNNIGKSGGKLTFDIDKLMAGQYVLLLQSSITGDVYYPGVTNIKLAEIFKVKERGTTSINFSTQSPKAAATSCNSIDPAN